MTRADPPGGCPRMVSGPMAKKQAAGRKLKTPPLPEGERLAGKIAAKRAELEALEDVEVGKEAAGSLRHCALQAEFWRLMQAKASLELADESFDIRVSAEKMIRVASEQGERWESRRQQALKVQMADDYAWCKAQMTEMLSQRGALQELDD